MNTVLEHVSAFWATYGEWMTVAMIPTVIAGLTISPKTKPATTWVTKSWDVVKMIMGFLSVLTHKDQPGTFQLPLKAGKAIKKVRKKKAVVPETTIVPEDKKETL